MPFFAYKCTMAYITEEEYLQAKKIIDTYLAEQRVKHLRIYDDCTVNDIVRNEYTERNKKAYAFWVTKSKDIPDRNPEGTIVDSGIGFFSLEHSSTAYPTYEAAYKQLIRNFRRKGFLPKGHNVKINEA